MFLLRAGSCCYVRQYLQTQFTLELHDRQRRASSIASDRQCSLTPLFETIVSGQLFFFLFLFNLFFFLFVFFLVFSTPQRITHLTGFYFVCVFPCYLPCRRQMGTKSRQRKVIFEFSCFSFTQDCLRNQFFLFFRQRACQHADTIMIPL